MHNVDELIAATHPREVADHFGYPWPNDTSRDNVRIACPVTDCQPSSYGQMSVRMSPPWMIKCHTCQVRGNLLTLLWTMKHKQPPDGGRLRGPQFKEAVEDLQQIHDGGTLPPARPKVVAEPVGAESPPPRPKNIPLARSPNERSRHLADLDQMGTIDVAEMTPGAARYFRQRPYLTQEMCDRWRVCYLPSSAKGTLRGRIIYGIESGAGAMLAWVGRDPDYESKEATWRTSQRGSPPMKHRFPTEKYFRRGLELYGQQASRLENPVSRRNIEELGLLVVEGMNAVIRLDELQVPAVALMSNRVTEDQVGKIVRFAQLVTRGRVALMLDNDEPGIEGGKDALWRLAAHTPVQTVWSPSSQGGHFAGRQPDSLSPEEWEELAASLRQRWSRLA